VGTDWTQSLQKAVQVQIALNIADVSAPAGQQPVRRMAARRTRHHLLLWPASLRWTRRLVIWRARKWQGVLCVQPYWITCGWLISRRCRQPTRNALRADQGGFKVSADSGPMPS
jgi:hypothetical protein